MLNTELFDYWHAGQTWEQMKANEGHDGFRLSEEVYIELQNEWPDGFYIQGWKEGNEDSEPDGYLEPCETKMVYDPKTLLKGIDKGSHSIYALHYHLILVVKYRRKVLYNEVVRERLKQIIYNMSENWQRVKDTEKSIEIVTLEPGEDHIHIFFKAGPNTSLTKVINSIKGASARVIRNEFPETKTILEGGALWAPSYFLATSGQVSMNVLIAYIDSIEEKTQD
jgi:putative transposase